MRVRTSCLIAWSLVALVAGTSQAAETYLLKGKKIVLATPPSGSANNKLVYLAKIEDLVLEAPNAPDEDPRCAPDGTGTASLSVFGDSDSFTIDLGGANCSNWSRNGAGNVYKYKDTTGATCKIVIIKDGKLVKAVCKGPQVDFALGGAQPFLDVVLSTGSSEQQYCSSFAEIAGCNVKKDGSNGKAYIATNCPSIYPCGGPGSPSGAFLNGEFQF